MNNPIELASAVEVCDSRLRHYAELSGMAARERGEVPLHFSGAMVAIIEIRKRLIDLNAEQQ